MPNYETIGDDDNPFRSPRSSIVDSPTADSSVTLPATPQRVYRLYERPMSASPASSPYRASTPVTPPLTAHGSTEHSNRYSAPYSPRYFEHTPNGSIHRPSSRTSTHARFSSISPRKLPPPPTFPDLRTLSPLNTTSTLDIPEPEDIQDLPSHQLQDDYSDLEEDDNVQNEPRDESDFGYILGFDEPRSETPNVYSEPNYSPSEDSYEEYDDELEKYEDTRHFGPAPDQPQPRRFKAMAKRQVQLTQGHLVLDNPVPSKLTSFLPRRDSEFTHMRYTAATCDPDDFARDGYTLRPALFGRETQLFIVVTMYNEDEILFTRTMHGIMRNIAHLCSRSKSRVWGKDGWQKVVVCVVADGRREIHPRVLDVLAAMGVYQDGIAKNLVNGKEVKAHIYEYTTQISVDPDLRFQGAEKGMVPVQVLFCLKEKNAKKLNSHRWFFNAFSPLLNPNVCVLLDVGTRPGGKSIYHLWKAFDHNSDVGGACGEIKAMKGKAWSSLLNPLVAAQNFEYKMSNILDKPTESVFGYISVLPGAFSAYRYIALKNDDDGKGPLNSYFKGEMLHGKNADVFAANMYLAEDRILCWELVAKKHEKWILEYVKSATGETDVPDAIPELVSQRRRWLNGAFFAAVYAQTHFTQIWGTDHSIGRKIALQIEFFYQFVNLAFSFFSLGNFYLTFYFVCSSLSDPSIDPFGSGWAQRIFTGLRYICILLIASQFILSMGNRPQGARMLFAISMCGFSFIMAYTLFATIYLTVKSVEAALGGNINLIGDNVFANVVLALMSTAGLYFLSSLLYLDPWHMFTSFLQFTLLLPSFVCTLQIYAFCNTHDVSWGTKGDNLIRTELGAAVSAGKGEKGDIVEVEVPSEQLDIDAAYDDALANVRERRPIPEKPVNENTLKEDYYREIRTRLVLVWIISNATLAMALTEVYSTGLSGTNGYLKFILWAIAGLSAFRFLGSTTYLLVNIVQRTARSKYYAKFSDA